MGYAAPTPITNVREGLDRAFTQAYVQAMGGWSSSTGAAVRVEAGATFWQRAKAFAYAEATERDTGVGAGVRYEF